MTIHEAEIAVIFPAARAVAEATVAHMAGHGARVTTGPGVWRIDFGRRRAEIALTPDGLRLSASGADASLLREMRMDLADHLAEFGGPTLPDWLGRDGEAPPNFRLMRVAEVTDPTPLMRRLRLTGEALTRYDRADAMHVKLLVPPHDAPPVWPVLDAKGRLRPGNGLIRKYTIRRIDPAAGWMEIDFVRHAPAGPASAWAEAAAPGDAIGLIGPGGAGIPLDRPLLLAGDETALPAIARALEALPPDIPARALIEIADAAERQPIATHARLDWLPRDGAPPGERLARAFRAAAPDPGTFVWAGCEFDAFRALRAHLRGPLGHPRASHLVTAYWRRGVAAERVEALTSAAVKG